MTRVAELHERWNRDPDYRKAYVELGPEFAVAKSLIEARKGAGFTQAELAARMKRRIAEPSRPVPAPRGSK